MDQPLNLLAENELLRLEECGLLRRRRIVRALDAVHVEVDGRRCVNFCSNNYLGLTHHPRVIAAMRSAAEKDGAGAGAAGLISGYSPRHAATEAAIARWKAVESAILLPSGYQANIAAVQTVAALAKTQCPGGVRFLVDKLSHASLLDAVAGTAADFRVFPHNGMKKLRRLLQDAPNEQMQVVVTESIFSMDGDAADLPALAQLKRERSFVLLLDEAHASGVYGPAGAGLAAECGVTGVVDISIATLSKAVGCAGGAICASESFCRAVMNLGRAYLFSTSLPPAVAAAIEAAIDTIRDEPCRASRVREHSRRLRVQLKKQAMDVAAGDCPIIPIIVGEERKAMQLSERLLQQGMLIAAIRPPTVPRGRSRLRITLSSEHSDEEIEALTAALGRER